MAFGVNETGLSMPRMADYLTIIRAEFEARLVARSHPLPDWDRDTFLGDLTAVMAARLDALSEAVIQVDAGYNSNNAEGVQLENICALVGVVRREATHSTVTLQITATTGTVVPENALVEDDDKQRWVISQSVSFPSDTTLEVVATAQEAGEVIALANSITRIVTPVDGWTAVNNSDPATTGEPRETDAELRRRRLLSLQLGTSATVAGIRAAVFALDEWVTAAVVVDNPSNATAIVEGLTLPAHSVAVVLYPNTPTAAQITELVETLAGVIPAGIEQYGDQSQAYTFDDGHAATFKWSYATEEAVDVTIIATALDGYTTGEVDAGIDAAVADYFLSLGVGDDVRAISISALVAAVEGVDTADVTVGAGAQKVTIDATQIAIAGTITSTVT